MAEETKMSTGDKLDALTRLENLFRPCAEARRIVEGLARLDGERV